MAQSFIRFIEAGTAQEAPVRVARWCWSGLGFFVLTGAALILGRFPVEVGEGLPIAPSLRLLAPLLWMIGCAIAASPMVLAFMYAWNAMSRTMPALAERAVFFVGSLAAGAVLLPIPFWIVAVMVVDGVAPMEPIAKAFATVRRARHPHPSGSWHLRMRQFVSSPFVLVRTLTAGALSVLAYGAVLGLIGVLAVVGPYREGTAFALPAGDALEQQRVQQFELGIVLSLVVSMSVVHGLVTMALVWRQRSLRAGGVVVLGALAALLSAGGGVLAFALASSLSLGPALDSWMVGAAVLVVAALPVPLVWFTERWRKTEPRADT